MHLLITYGYEIYNKIEDNTKNIYKLGWNKYEIKNYNDCYSRFRHLLKSVKVETLDI